MMKLHFPVTLLLIRGHSSVFRLDNQHSGYCLGTSFWPCKYPADANVACATVHGAITSVCVCSQIVVVHQTRVATGNTIFSVCQAHIGVGVLGDIPILTLALTVSSPCTDDRTPLWCLGHCPQKQVAASSL